MQWVDYLLLQTPPLVFSQAAPRRQTPTAKNIRYSSPPHHLHHSYYHWYYRFFSRCFALSNSNWKDGNMQTFLFPLITISVIIFEKMHIKKSLSLSSTGSSLLSSISLLSPVVHSRGSRTRRDRDLPLRKELKIVNESFVFFTYNLLQLKFLFISKYSSSKMACLQHFSVSTISIIHVMMVMWTVTMMMIRWRWLWEDGSVWWLQQHLSSVMSKRGSCSFTHVSTSLSFALFSKYTLNNEHSKW